MMNILEYNFKKLNIDEQKLISNILYETIEKINIAISIEIEELNKVINDMDIRYIDKNMSLKEVHLFCVKNKIPGQVSGPLLENYIITHYNMTKNNAQMHIGDAYKNNINYEIKISLGGKDRNKFNYVQLRPNHNCSYILTAYYINNSNLYKFGELFVFKLNKDQMIDLIYKFGGYAHGSKKQNGSITIELLKSNQVYEYALRVKFNSKCWNNLLQFRIDPSAI